MVLRHALAPPVRRLNLNKRRTICKFHDFQRIHEFEVPRRMIQLPDPGFQRQTRNIVPALVRIDVVVFRQAKLVPQFGNPVLANPDLDDVEIFSGLVQNDYLFDPPSGPDLRGQRMVLDAAGLVEGIAAHQHGRLVAVLPHLDNAPLVQLCVIEAGLQILPHGQFRIRRIANTNTGLCLGVVLLHHLIGAVAHGAKEALVKGVLVKDNAVVLIVAGPEGHGQHDILPIGHAPLPQIVGVEGSAQGRLSVAQNMGRIVEPVRPIRGVHANRLFGLVVAQLVTGTLVVMTIRDEGGHYAQNGRGVDLDVGRLGHHLVGEVGNEGLVLLIGIHVFDTALEGLEFFPVLFERPSF